jgi:hypothetical protein
LGSINDVRFLLDMKSRSSHILASCGPREKDRIEPEAEYAPQEQS